MLFPPELFDFRHCARVLHLSLASSSLSEMIDNVEAKVRDRLANITHFLRYHLFCQRCRVGITVGAIVCFAYVCHREC